MFCKAGKTLKMAHNNSKEQREDRWRSENFTSELGQYKRTAGQSYSGMLQRSSLCLNGTLKSDQR